MPRLLLVPFASKKLAEQVVRSTLRSAPLDYLQSGSSTTTLRPEWVGLAKKEHAREYGFSILTAILVGVMIKVAVGVMIELWLNHHTRDTLVRAIMEARES
jgi:hypothetical protein